MTITDDGEKKVHGYHIAEFRKSGRYNENESAIVDSEWIGRSTNLEEIEESEMINLAWFFPDWFVFLLVKTDFYYIPNKENIRWNKKYASEFFGFSEYNDKPAYVNTTRSRLLTTIKSKRCEGIKKLDDLGAEWTSHKHKNLMLSKQMAFNKDCNPIITHDMGENESKEYFSRLIRNRKNHSINVFKANKKLGKSGNSSSSAKTKGSKKGLATGCAKRKGDDKVSDDSSVETSMPKKIKLKIVPEKGVKKGAPGKVRWTSYFYTIVF